MYDYTKKFIEQYEGGGGAMRGTGSMTDAEYQDWLRTNIEKEGKPLNFGQRISKDIKDWWNSDVDVKLIGLKILMELLWKEVLQ